MKAGATVGAGKVGAGTEGTACCGTVFAAAGAGTEDVTGCGTDVAAAAGTAGCGTDVVAGAGCGAMAAAGFFPNVATTALSSSKVIRPSPFLSDW